MRWPQLALEVVRRWAAAGLGILGCAGILAFLVRAATLGKPPRVVQLGAILQAATGSAGMAIGPPQARVVVRVFGDYECWACAALDSATGTVLRNWARDSLLRFIYYHAPLRAHRRGPIAAAAALCAGAAARPWEMHELLYRRRGEWSAGPPPEQSFGRYSRELGLNPDTLQACLASPRTAARVGEDARAAKRLGVESVPAVYVNEALIEIRSAPQLLAYVREALRRRSP